MRRLRPASVILAFLLLLILAYTAWWASAAWQVRAGIERWAAEQRDSGADVTYEGLTVDGFPLELAVSLRNARLRLPDGTEAAADAVEAAADPWNPLDIRLTRLASPRALLPDGAGGAMALQAVDGVGTLALGLDGRARQATLDLTGVTLAEPGAGPGLTAERLALAVSQPDAPPTAHTDPAGTLDLRLSSLTFAHGVDPSGGVLGTAVARIGGRLTLLGRLDGLAGDQLRIWRDSGGTVEVTDALVDWGGLVMTGDATLALDGEMQPLLAGTVRMERGELLLDALAGSGVVPPRQAAQLKPFVGFLAQPGEDGVRRVTLPIAVQDRRLALGPAIIATLPEIVWK